MNRMNAALSAISLVSAIGCGSGFPPGSGNDAPKHCGPGSHMEDTGCMPNRTREDCTGSIDADGDGKVPALDPDCADAGKGDAG